MYALFIHLNPFLYTLQMFTVEMNDIAASDLRRAIINDIDAFGVCFEVLCFHVS